MKQARLELSLKPSPPAAQILLPLLAVLFLTGCDLIPTPTYSITPVAVYQPKNVYLANPGPLPFSLRRVVVLPMTVASDAPELQAGVEALEPALRGELEKTQRFEVVTIAPEQLRQLTGKPAWRADEPLPEGFFEKLQRETGSDAVMFSQMTHYRPYEPVAVGLKLSLAAKFQGDTKPYQIIWSVDEVLDAGDPGVAKAARYYYSQHIRAESSTSDPSTILRSPTLFDQYSLGALFGTLPVRSY